MSADVQRNINQLPLIFHFVFWVRIGRFSREQPFGPVAANYTEEQVEHFIFESLCKCSRLFVPEQRSRQATVLFEILYPTAQHLVDVAMFFYL